MKYLYIIFILFHLSIYSQTKQRYSEVYKTAFKIDSTKGNATEFELKIDSINVQGHKYANKIESKCNFEKSKTELNINYYFQDNKVFLVMVKEPAPGGIKELFSESIYFVKNDRIVGEDFRNTVLPCLAVPNDKNIFELYGYNKAISGKFMTRYIFELLEKIQNHR